MRRQQLGHSDPDPLSQLVSPRGVTARQEPGREQLTPFCDRELCQGDIVVHVRRVLHSTAERPIVLQSGFADADGCIPFVHISNPGNPVSECARCRWVLERLVVEDLRKQYHDRKG